MVNPIVAKVEELGKDSLVEAMAIMGKHERGAAIKSARNALIAQLTEGMDDAATADYTKSAKQAWSKLLTKIMRTKVAQVDVDWRAVR